VGDKDLRGEGVIFIEGTITFSEPGQESISVPQNEASSPAE
jgi:hypothetical protein